MPSSACTIPPPPSPTLFPYTTLFRSWPPLLLLCLGLVGFGTGTWSNFGPMFAELFPTRLRTTAVGSVFNAARGVQFVAPLVVAAMARDRKSTRLNSSHRCISYAVFCLYYPPPA